MDFLFFLSNHVKELRLAQSVSQQTLATAIGVTKASISRIETSNQSVTVETLISLADYFNVSIDYLLGRTNNPLSHMEVSNESN